jgi:diguanylate cyclase (GGDEF)-like protein/PAS domain S-box-containing protein
MFEQAHDPAVIVDETGRIVLANTAVERVLGYAPEALMAQPIEVLVPERYRDHMQHRQAFFAGDRPRPMGRGVQLFARRADGVEIPVDVSLSPFMADGRRFAKAALRDLRGRGYGVESLKVQAKALHAAANGVVITDREGFIHWVNPAACAITGYPEGELVGRHTRMLKSGLHAESFYRHIWGAIGRGETWTGTIVNKRKDGTLYREEQTIAPVTDEHGAVTHFIAIKQDVTERLRLQDELVRAHADLAARLAEIEVLNNRLREQAIRDPLTLLHNRRFFDDAVARDVARITREHTPLSLVLIDIDHFKFVNDEWGHASGDRVLVRLADVLRAEARSADLVCRLGGEEFVIVMPGAEAAVAAARAEQWRLAFAEAVTVSDVGTDIRCTMSLGVAEHDPAGASVYDTLLRADRALYAAKQAGRNCTRVAAAAPG